MNYNIGLFDKLLSRLKITVKGRRGLWRIHTTYRKLNERISVPETDLCVEGFPRSGNTFFVCLLETANPSGKYAHHTHNILNIQRAIKYNIPILVPIRNPLDAIVSSIMRRSVITRESASATVFHACKEYEIFFSFLLANIEKLTIIPFEYITKSPDELLSYICGKTPNFKVEGDRTYKEVVDEAWAHSKNIKYDNTNSAFAASIPTKEKELKKEKMREDVSSAVQCLGGERLEYLYNEVKKHAISLRG